MKGERTAAGVLSTISFVSYFWLGHAALNRFADAAFQLRHSVEYEQAKELVEAEKSCDSLIANLTENNYDELHDILEMIDSATEDLSSDEKKSIDEKMEFLYRASTHPKERQRSLHTVQHLQIDLNRVKLAYFEQSPLHLLEESEESLQYVLFSLFGLGLSCFAGYWLITSIPKKEEPPAHL